MDETPPAASKDAALHEYIEAQATVGDLETPGQAKTLHAALEQLSGIESVSIAGGKVAVHDEPVRITTAQLIEAIQGAGFRIAEVESVPASPLTDAFAGKAEAPPDREASLAQQKTSS